MYREQGQMDGIAELCSFENVQIEGKDDMTMLCRRGFEVTGKPSQLEKRTTKRAQGTTDADADAFSEIFDKNTKIPGYNRAQFAEWLEPLEPFLRTTKVVRPRVHCRLLLKTVGCALTYFESLEELMQVFIDAVEGILCPRQI